MSTFQTRVEDYVGTVTDTTALTDYLTAGARIIINMIPEHRLERYASEISDSGSGATITSYRFVRAHKNGRRAIQINAGEKYRINDPNSLYTSDIRDPHWYIEAGKIYVVPNGGTILGVAYPSVAYNDSTISGFPLEMEQATVLYCAIQILLGRTNTILQTLDALTLDTVTAPTAPADATYSYSDATIGTYTSTTIGDLGTPPTYTKPTTTFDMTNASSYIASEEDIEKATAEISKQATILEQFAKDLYNELNEFNKENEIYKSTVQKALEQARLDQERLLTIGRDTTNLNLQNKIQTLQGDISLYQSKINKYLAQIEEYGASVNKAVQKLATAIQKYTNETQANANLIGQLQAEFQRVVSVL